MDCFILRLWCIHSFAEALLCIHGVSLRIRLKWYCFWINKIPVGKARQRIIEYVFFLKLQECSRRDSMWYA